MPDDATAPNELVSPEMHRTTIEVPTFLWDSHVSEAKLIGLSPVQFLRVLLKERYPDAKPR